MDKQTVLKSIKEIKENSSKRKFVQTLDLVIQLKDLDLKKPDHKVDAFITLPHTLGKKMKVCGLVKQLAEKSKEAFDETIPESDFVNYAKDKKAVKKLASSFDFFVAQADLMGKVATTFGRYFGPKGKMPSPKAGCVVPAVIPDLKSINERLQKTVRAQTKNELSIKVPVGKESMKDEELEDNIEAVYNTVVKALPNEKNNVYQVILKLTMGRPYIVGKGFIEKKEQLQSKVETKKKTVAKKIEKKVEVKK